jgi:hypothetical protein
MNFTLNNSFGTPRQRKFLEIWNEKQTEGIECKPSKLMNGPQKVESLTEA